MLKKSLLLAVSIIMQLGARTPFEEAIFDKIKQCKTACSPQVSEDFKLFIEKFPDFVNVMMPVTIGGLKRTPLQEATLQRNRQLSQLFLQKVSDKQDIKNAFLMSIGNCDKVLIEDFLKTGALESTDINAALAILSAYRYVSWSAYLLSKIGIKRLLEHENKQATEVADILRVYQTAAETTQIA